MTKKKKIKSVEDIEGVGPRTAEKLADAGFIDLMKIANMPVADLMETTELSSKACKKIQNEIRASLEMNFIKGTKMKERRMIIGRITTGSEGLNELIGGGVETQSITEFSAPFGCGKSQVGFQLAVNVQLPIDQGGLDGDVIFLDTEGTFRTDRIEQLAKALKLDTDKVLDRIYVSRVQSSDHQILLIEKLDETIKEHKLNIKLIIIDGLMSLFRSEYIGRGTLANRQQLLNKHLHALQRISELHNTAIYITNQVSARPDFAYGDPNTPIGGNIVAHASTYRVFLRKSKGTRRIAKLMDSPNLEDGERVFHVKKEGITD